MNRNYRYTVCTRCFTYNHEAFIVDAMNGFIIQETDFPVVTTIVDDASTDDTPKLVRQFFYDHFDWENDPLSYQKEEAFGSVLFARHKSNKNCCFAIILLKENHFKQNKSKMPFISPWCQTARYHAICEGDDYWTDPHKLQKQVDFMESNSGCSLCFHKVYILADKEDERHFFENLEEREYTSREIYETWSIPTCSVLYRNLEFDMDKRIYYGDTYLWLRLSERGKIYCLGFFGGVYRRHSGSLTAKMSTADYLRLADQYRYMGKRFPKLRDISRRKEESYLKHIIHMPYFDGIWKYRFRYMFLHPNLFFSTFFTTTLLSYTPFRHH